MKPRQNYRSRPKKTGAAKIGKVNSQIKRLIAAGYEKEKLTRMTSVEVRDLLKVAGKKKLLKTEVAR